MDKKTHDLLDVFMKKRQLLVMEEVHDRSGNNNVEDDWNNVNKISYAAILIATGGCELHQHMWVILNLLFKYLKAYLQFDISRSMYEG